MISQHKERPRKQVSGPPETGAVERTRTPNPLVRSQMLYPIELLPQSYGEYTVPALYLQDEKTRSEDEKGLTEPGRRYMVYGFVGGRDPPAGICWFDVEGGMLWAYVQKSCLRPHNR